MLITGAVGGWWPDRTLSPGLGLVAGIVIVAAVSLLGSVYLSSTANGIAVFMVFGAGLVAGLLGQIGEGIGSDTLKQIGRTASWFVPFEALYQSGLARAYGGRERADGLRGLARAVRRRPELERPAVAVGGRIPRAAGRGCRLGIPQARPVGGLFRTM